MLARACLFFGVVFFYWIGVALAARAWTLEASSMAVCSSSLVANLMLISGVMSGSAKPGVFRVRRRGALRIDPEMCPLATCRPGSKKPAPS